VQLPPAEIIDFFSDTSFQKFLDDDHGLSDEYRPEDIISLHSDFTANYSSNFQLRKEAGEQFADMARAFANAFSFKSKLSLTSAYRSPTYQKQLASTCSTQRCALPGTSEHEAGLALDLGVNGGNILGNQ
jgi:LAS superfamily LD-carboxypeptidase LdcB